MGLIFGQLYSEYKDLLLILWLATGITFAFRVKAVELRTSGRARSVWFAYLIASFVMVLFAYPLIAQFGVVGAAVLICIGVLSNYLVQILESRLVSNK